MRIAPILFLIVLALTACGGGDPAAAPATASVKAWGTATLIETDNAGGAYDPQIAVDANGNALAVWWQFDGTRTSI